ncbi:extracellular solute-binding protein [Brachybacterium muris]|uniref:ABC transporter substrate-binding protein n=1 Tax=Brachybacterium muris UCD-AY4 TaxID=1249481 RepID=A0A022KYU8_9MICO|nr:extracellular solute-binding protein [Brachybacterium muris]EYT49740.1 ABC transporter substrate-binding protein [Brachybacterium muris UCD-AY4]
MRRRSFISYSLAAGGTLGSTAVLAACGGSSAGSGGSDGGSSASGPLVIYSNSVSEGRGDWLAEQAKAEGFELQFVDLGGGDIQNRLIAEAANPIADVVFGLNNVYFENIKAAGALAPYTPAWSDAVEADLGDGESFWPIVREPIMLVYNTAAFPTPQDAPADWPELWEDPAFHGRYENPRGLGGATTQMVLSGIISRHLDPAGDLGVSAEGWTAVEQYFANGSPAVEGTDLYARMAGGDVDMGQMWLAGKASREKEHGITTEPVKPEIGVPMATQHIALVKDSQRAEAAQQFIDWFGGAEVQAAWSQEFFTAPTNQDALADANPEAVEQTDAFTAQEIDWPTVAANLPDWVEKIELEYLG